MRESVVLKRSLSLPQLVLDGLGTTIGADIYALVATVFATIAISLLAVIGNLVNHSGGIFAGQFILVACQAKTSETGRLDCNTRDCSTTGFCRQCGICCVEDNKFI